MTTFIIIGIIVNLILSFFVSESGSSREIGRNKSFWISAVFGFLPGALITMSSRPLDKEEMKNIKEDDGEISASIFKFCLLVGGIFFAFYLFSDGEEKNCNYSTYTNLDQDGKWEDYKRVSDSISLANINSMENPYKWEMKKSNSSQ